MAETFPPEQFAETRRRLLAGPASAVDFITLHKNVLLDALRLAASQERPEPVADMDDYSPSDPAGPGYSGGDTRAAGYASPPSASKVEPQREPGSARPLSPETQAQLAAIDDNRRHAAATIGNMIVGVPSQGTEREWSSGRRYMNDAIRKDRQEMYDAGKREESERVLVFLRAWEGYATHDLYETYTGQGVEAARMLADAIERGDHDPSPSATPDGGG